MQPVSRQSKQSKSKHPCVKAFPSNPLRLITPNTSLLVLRLLIPLQRRFQGERCWIRGNVASTLRSPSRSASGGKQIDPGGLRSPPGLSAGKNYLISSAFIHPFFFFFLFLPKIVLPKFSSFNIKRVKLPDTAVN